MKLARSVITQLLVIIISAYIGWALGNNIQIDKTILISFLGVLLCLALITFILTWLSTAIDKHNRDWISHSKDISDRTKDLLDSNETIRAKIRNIFEDATPQRISKIEETMNEICNRVSVRIDYVERDAQDSKSMEVYRRVNEVVGSARESILVVNSYLVECDLPKRKQEQNAVEQVLSSINDEQQREQRTDARDEYYNLLIEKSKFGVNYKRVLQGKPDNTTLPDLVNDVDHLRHYSNMIKEIKSGNRHITLKIAPARRLTTYVIVDKEHLIWQINEVVFTKQDELWKEELRLHGIFIIHDPQKEIISHFLDYFDLLEWDSETVHGCVQSFV